MVCGLTAHLSVERGLIENDQHAFLGLLVGGDGVGQSLLIAQRHNDAVALEGVVADELGGLSGQSAEQIFAPAGDVLLEALCTGALLLLLHLTWKPSSSISMPCSAAISLVRSRGKPKVSFSLKTSRPFSRCS